MSRLWQCTDGVAAIEFAYLAPLLLLMLLATIELGRAINIDRHFTTATAMTGDLVAREEKLGDTKTESDAALDGIVKSIEHLMSPYDTSDLKLGIISVKASSDDASVTKVEWSYPHNGMSVPSQCETYTLPAGIVDKGESVIVVESNYVFRPLFADFVPGISGDTTWTDKSIHSPRNSCVDYAGANCLLDCP